jgi:hypothetical protein
MPATRAVTYANVCIAASACHRLDGHGHGQHCRVSRRPQISEASALQSAVGGVLQVAVAGTARAKKKLLPPVNRRWVEEGAERVRAEPWSWPLPYRKGRHS